MSTMQYIRERLRELNALLDEVEYKADIYSEILSLEHELQYLQESYQRKGD